MTPQVSRVVVLFLALVAGVGVLVMYRQDQKLVEEDTVEKEETPDRLDANKLIGLMDGLKKFSGDNGNGNGNKTSSSSIRVAAGGSDVNAYATAEKFKSLRVPGVNMTKYKNPDQSLPPDDRMDIPKYYVVDTAKVQRLEKNQAKLVGKDRSELKRTQIENYKNGVGLMVMVHITHHAGTTFCRDFIKPIGNAPYFACMAGDNWPKQHDQWRTNIPWQAESTETAITELREYFHEVSWEFGHQSKLRRTLASTDWENERLLSVIVMRNPMDRLLAFDGMASKQYGEVKNRTADEWWRLAQHPVHNNNFALRVLSDYNNCCQGKDTPVETLESAKALMQRFTIVMDQDCLNENLVKLAQDLEMPFHPREANKHESARVRIHNDTLYDFLMEKNTQDIKLYEWSKQMSLVVCDRHEE